MELFHSTVVPVMLYGCDIWGYENIDMLEKLQLRFLKYLFILHKTTMTVMIYGEMGIYMHHYRLKCESFGLT